MAKNIALDIQIKNVKKITDLKNSLKELRKEQKGIEKATKEGSKSQGISSSRYKENAKAIDGQSKSLRGLNKTMKGATTSSGSMSKSFVKGAAAVGLIIGAFRMITSLISSTIKTFSEFEFMMAKVNAVSGATNEEFKQLTATAEELGRTTFYTASQVGELMLNFSKLGFSAQEIQDAVKPTLDLATATGSDLARSATVAGAAIRGFGLDASETGRVVDVMAVTFANSAMDIEKWQTAMTKVAPIAKSAGFSIEDTAAMMSKLTDAGIEASIAGTSLRNIILKMQDPTSELSQSFGGTIHSLDQLVPAMEDFVLQGGSMADVMEVVDIRQAAAFETMLMSADTLIDFRDKLDDATGQGSVMATMVGKTLQGSFLKLKSAIQGVAIGVMKSYSGALQKNINIAANWLNILVSSEERIEKLINTVKTIIKTLAAYVVGLKVSVMFQKALAANVTATGVAVNGANIATKIFTVSLRGLKAAIATTGIGLLVIGLAEAAAGFFFAASAEEKLAAVTDEYGRSIVGIVDKEKTLDDIRKGAEAADSKKITMIDELIKKFDDETTSLEDQEKILKKLNKINPEFFSELDAGKATFEGLTKSADKYKDKLLELATFELSITKKAENDLNLKDLERQLGKNEKVISKYKKSLKEEGYSAKEIEGGLAIQEALAKKGVETGDNKEAFEAFQKISLIKKEIKEANSIAKELQKTIDAADVKDLLDEADPGGGGPDKEGQKSAKYDLMLTNKQNALRQRQLDGLETIEVTSMKMIEASMQVNRQEFATLKESELNGKRGADLRSQFLTDQLKLNDLIEKKGLDASKLNFDTKIMFLKEQLKLEEITKSEFDTQVLNLEKERIENEQDLLRKRFDDNLITVVEYDEEFIRLKSKLVSKELDIEKNSIKLQEKALDDQFEKDKIALKSEESLTMMSQIDFNLKMLEIEKAYLLDKAGLHEGNALKLIGIQNDISENDIKTNKAARDLLNEQVSSMKNVGDAMVSLAGDNENLNKVKEVGNKISQAANVITTISTTLKHLQTLGILTKVGAENAETISQGKNTASTIYQTIADKVSLIPKAIKSVLKSAGGPLGIFGAIAMLLFVKKLMKTKFSDGGVVNEDNKYAKGGMVHGASHANGGVKFSAGGRVNELEGGEAVINKRSTAMFRNQLSDMNQAGGGVKFADGGLLSSPAFSEAQFNANNQNKMMGAMSGQRKVIVVESDITNSQTNVSVIQSNASF